MILQVSAELLGTKLYRMVISHHDQIIGEYERSQEADIDRKTEEIRCASELLLSVFRSKGQFIVRWDGARRVKSIRVNGTEVATVPPQCWRKPSWK